MNRTVGWERFKEMPLYGRVLIVLFAAALAWEITGKLLDTTGGGGDRSTSSSFSTKPRGMAAYAELLGASGHPVDRVGGSLEDAALTGGETLVVAGAALDDDDVDALVRFVQSGGRGVLLGRDTAPAAGALVDGNLAIRPDEEEAVARVAAPTAETAGVSEVVFAGGERLVSAGPMLPILASPDGLVVAAAASVGAGRVVLIADETPFENRVLAEADNAAFGLAVAGPSGRPVVFSEGTRAGRGIAAIPREWRNALLAGLLAVFLAMWSAGRRFGPPEDEGRELAPPRRAYVDAMAATLVKTRQPESALAPLRAAARERIRRQATLPPDADERQLRKAGADLGLSASETAAVFDRVHNDEQAMDLGRAMARLGGAKW